MGLTQSISDSTGFHARECVYNSTHTPDFRINPHPTAYGLSQRLERIFLISSASLKKTVRSVSAIPIYLPLPRSRNNLQDSRLASRWASGQWLSENAPRGTNLEIPRDRGSKREIPFIGEEID